MNKKFCGFYTPKQDDYKEIWNDKNTLFIFDTNTLLNLYRCEEQTKDDILNVMTMLASRSWFPFHVCLEYQRNRINVISQSLKSLEKLKKSITSLVYSTDNALSEAQVKKHLYIPLSEEVSLLKDSLSVSINSFIADKIEPRIEAKEKIKVSDFIRKRLDEIIGENCGDIPSQETINKINEDGNSRYANKIPPGFMDEKDKGEGVSFYNGIEFKDKFGDLYLWKEILEISKKHDNYNIIFITDDSKKDWWFSHDNKTIGPSEALQTEIYFNSSIKSFRMINHSSFLYEAGQYLDNLQIEPSSVDDIKEISSADLDMYKKDSLDTIMRQSFPINPSKDIKVRHGSKSHHFKSLFTHTKRDSIINAHEHFRIKYDELLIQYIELNELISFNYDLISDDEEAHTKSKFILQEIKNHLANLDSSINFIEDEIDSPEIQASQSTIDMMISTISTQILKIQNMIINLSKSLD